MMPSPARLCAAALAAGRGLRWYVTTLMGDHDYDRYVAHLASAHPDVEPVGLREYWRSRHADSAVQARCC